MLYVCNLIFEFSEMKKKCTEEEAQLARFAKAMGHPTRIMILKFLASRTDCFFGDIHEALPIAKATVSQHLSELKNSGLIQGEILPPKVKYCINPGNWALAKELFSDFMGSYKNKNKEVF
jgi:DNA-binding HxlR family transcriptional regulator